MCVHNEHVFYMAPNHTLLDCSFAKGQWSVWRWRIHLEAEV